MTYILGIESRENTSGGEIRPEAACVHRYHSKVSETTWLLGKWESTNLRVISFLTSIWVAAGNYSNHVLDT